MGCQSVDEMTAIEAAPNDLIEQNHDVSNLVFQCKVDDAEVVVGIEHVQVFDDLLIGDGALTERHCLVEDAQRVAHSAISLLGNHCQRLLFILDAFLLGHVLQMGDGILHRHAFEVVDLTTRDDGWQNLVLLRGGKDEDDVCRRFLKRLQECVEGLRGEHVHLVDDEHLVASYLRRNARLLHERLDVLHGVVRGSVELEDVVRPLLVESLARLAVVASLALVGRRQTVDGLGEDAGTSGLANASRSTEQVGMGELSTAHSILQRCRERRLSDDAIEGHRAVFTC